MAVLDSRLHKQTKKNIKTESYDITPKLKIKGLSVIGICLTARLLDIPTNIKGRNNVDIAEDLKKCLNNIIKIKGCIDLVYVFERHRNGIVHIHSTILIKESYYIEILKTLIMKLGKKDEIRANNIIENFIENKRTTADYLKPLGITVFTRLDYLYKKTTDDRYMIGMYDGCDSSKKSSYNTSKVKDIQDYKELYFIRNQNYIHAYENEMRNFEISIKKSFNHYNTKKRKKNKTTKENEDVTIYKIISTPPSNLQNLVHDPNEHILLKEKNKQIKELKKEIYKLSRCTLKYLSKYVKEIKCYTNKNNMKKDFLEIRKIFKKFASESIEKAVRLAKIKAKNISERNRKKEQNQKLLEIVVKTRKKSLPSKKSKKRIAIRYQINRAKKRKVDKF
ncbi:MAG: hypothetical protein GX282_01665 [Campylobacteraceae bacterium]|nr:hypothetical protein [Campylobacteraceae bacterium]